MIRYKILNDENEILGITTDQDLRYVQHNEDHSGVQLCNNNKYAFGIAFNGEIYSLYIDEPNYPLVTLATIGLREYRQIEKILNDQSNSTTDKKDINIKDYIPEDTSTLNLVKNSKIQEIKEFCNKNIVSGIDVTLIDNKIYHFDLTIEDQLNLQIVQSQINEGKTFIPFHAKNDEFKYFGIEDLKLIISEANNHILYHNIYFNCLKQYINSLSKTDKISEITYGIEIPDKYKSEILLSLENKQINTKK